MVQKIITVRDMRKIIKKIIGKIDRWLNPQLSDLEIIKKHGVQYGENVHIYGHDFDLKYGPLLSIGNNVTVTYSKILLHDASPSKFLDSNYGTKLKKVEIGNNVFIGYGSIILPGTVIEDNVIVGAGTVVRGVVSSDSVICGNPWQKVCSLAEYIERHKEKLGTAVKYDGNNFAEVARMLEEGNDVYIR